MSQKFLTYNQHLDKLQNKKGLIIPNPQLATKSLEELSYYSLIVGYKTLFLHPSSQKYKYGVTFDELVQFYYFDEQLRTLFLKYILQVERHLKSMISYFFCQKYGESQTEYLNPGNFDYITHTKAVMRLITSIQKILSLPTHYKYIAHHF